MSKLLHYFKDADMRCTHDGLTKIAKKAKVKADSLGPGEFVLFVNRAQTMFKLLGPNRTLVHVKAEPNCYVDLRTLRYLPNTFEGKTFNYRASLKKILEQDLGV